ncbi:glycosyl transferase [Rozella allomycis CSF55]|uniref:alpha-1,3-mannosyl-glycoprotein 2-beta-N-acetylglucosaminyltransferase n=1 Tax=Rozella allomycis (strain CSF55) TaxID=988480 RepID=A0A4P9YJ93_ROZAC|nr:glycosyl transferase [Rozella allomycis CSF55]
MSVEKEKRAAEITTKAIVSDSIQEPVIPILMFGCNRPSIKRALESLLAVRRERIDQHPIYVSLDCKHTETIESVKAFGDAVNFWVVPDHQEELAKTIPPNTENFMKPYYAISFHYKYALKRLFGTNDYEQVIIVEDDFEFSPDFLSYFRAMLPILVKDKSLYCVSSWNDNGKNELINDERKLIVLVKLLGRVFRTDFFPGLGWMMTRELWNEIEGKWPAAFWDDWLREPENRNSRQCIVPEVSRTSNFGKIGTSNGQFYDSHIRHVVKQDGFYDFEANNWDYLGDRERYNQDFLKQVYEYSTKSSLESVKKNFERGNYRIEYADFNEFQNLARTFGLMSDIKGGIPRMSFEGIVTLKYRKQNTVYLAPKRIDPKEDDLSNLNE